jgi:hypothetical protein
MSEAVRGVGVLDAMMACVGAVRDVRAAGRATPPATWLPFAGGR